MAFTRVIVFVSVLLSVEVIVMVLPLLLTDVAPPPLNLTASPFEIFSFVEPFALILNE